MRFFTFRKKAEEAKQPGQKVMFKRGKGYYLVGKAKAVLRPFTMYDSITLSEIPAGSFAVAGYVNGHWPTFPKLSAYFPHAKRLSIAVNTSHDAACLDVENGDATPDQAPAWVKRQHARGLKKPIVYTFLAQAQTLVNALHKSGYEIGTDYKLWVAHWNGKPHICGPECGYGLRVRAQATQYTNAAFGKNLDASYCSPRFF